ncbi:hemerythrin domain-containing protein, partial [Thermomonas sp.]|uniref:hemerythrin domain-containing protein n=1 Tax=Thermomonas sp. TaxID=1971895 RepID=UPI002624FA96
MTRIDWRPDFSIGIADVDHEHQELIAWINRTLVASLDAAGDRSVVTDLLGEVFAKVSAHFALEERVMRDQGYDQFTEHKRDHELLLDDIRDIMDDFEAGGELVEERFAT